VPLPQQEAGDGLRRGRTHLPRDQVQSEVVPRCRRS
jgi:hypothetical protein